jgi:flagellar biosynthesis protein FlgN
MDNIASLTEAEIELISRFISLLMEEQSALKSANVAALPEIGNSKLPLIDQLNTIEFTRSKLLNCSQSENVRTAMLRWLDDHPNDKTTANNWNKVLKLARQAKQAHELNGRLIQMHLQQNSEILGILTRQSKNNSLYGSNGQTAATMGNRIIDSA